MEKLGIVLKPVAYIGTGMALIIGSLVALGMMIDHLAAFYQEGPLPWAVEWVPSLLMIVGVGWGAYFIWKGTMAYDAGYTVLRDGADKVLLHRLSHHNRIVIGTPLVIAGVVICIIVMIRFFLTGLEVDRVSPADIGRLVLGLALVFIGLLVGPRRVQPPVKDAAT